MNSLITNNLQKGFPANGDELAFIQGVSDYLRQFNSATIGTGNHILTGFSTYYDSRTGRTTANGGEVSYNGELYTVKDGAVGLIVSGRYSIEEFGIVFDKRTDERPYQNGETLPAYTIREAKLVAPGTANAVSVADFTRVMLIPEIQKRVQFQKWNRNESREFTSDDSSIITQTNLDVKVKSNGDINIIGVISMPMIKNGITEEVPVINLSDANNAFPSLTMTNSYNYLFPCMLRRERNYAGIGSERLVASCRITSSGELRLRVPQQPEDYGNHYYLWAYININFNNQ